MSEHALHVTHHHPLAIGWTVSTVLVMLFILCILLGLFVPTRLAHGTAFVTDAAGLSGIAFDMAVSIVLGWTAPLAAILAYRTVRVR
jgi:hypothetical protein